MVRGFKNVCLALLFVGAAQSASAFSLLGPSPATGQTNPALAWQDADPIGIGAPYVGDIGGPLNLGEEFRWNVPVVTYGYDSSFLNYFGLDGVAAVEKAIGILNNLGPVSNFPDDLSNFPLDATRENFQASALNLIDLKSVTLHLLLEELGLADPIRYTWQIRARRPFTLNNQPIVAWWTVNRNFDPFTLNPSAHVNNVLYTYRIGQFTNPMLDEAIEVRVDPTARNNYPVASEFAYGEAGIYFTGLTRDDAGGFRYLYRTNNYNIETFPTGIDVLETNYASPELLQTYDWATFVENTQNTTNTQADVLALYPLASITNVVSWTTNVDTTNYMVTFPGFPLDLTPETNTLVTTLTETRFSYMIDNLKLLRQFDKATNFVDQLTVTAATNFVPPYGNFVTNRTRITQVHSVTTNTADCKDTTFTNTFNTPSTNDDVVVTVTTCLTNYTHTVDSYDGATLIGSEVVADMVATNLFHGEIYFIPTNVHDYVTTNKDGSITLDGNFTNTLTINRTNVSGQLLQDFFPFTNDLAGEIPLYTMDLALLTTNTFKTTNTPAQMLALITNLVITRTNITQERFQQVTLSNNVIVTNEFVTNAYTYSFGNIITNDFVERQWITNRLVEVLANPVGGITGQTNITNILLETIVTTGGSDTTFASVDLDPLGVQNDLNFTAKYTGASYNGVEVRFIDDASLTGNVAVATYTNSAKLLAINIDSEATDASAVVAALQDPETVGGSGGGTSRGLTRFGLPNSHLLFEAAATGTAGDGLLVTFANAPRVLTTVPGRLDFIVGAAIHHVDPARPVSAYYDTAAKRLAVYLNPGVTTAEHLRSYLAAVTTNNIDSFRAAYTTTLDTSFNPANDGSDVLAFGGAAASAFNVTTTGGLDGTPSSVDIEMAGPNNNLRFEAVAGGAGDDGLKIRFLDENVITNNTALPIYDAAGNVLYVYILSQTTDANAVKTAIDSDPYPDMVAFRARYAVTLATNASTEPTNDGTGTLAAVPFTAALDATGEETFRVAGLNNDLLFDSVPGGGAAQELFVALFDIGSSVGASPRPTYDPDANHLLVEIEQGVTTAAEIVAAVATSTTDADMATFRALYTVGLDNVTDAGNSGAGTYAALPLEASLEILDGIGNVGIGKLGANVNVAVLEEFPGGDFVAVPVANTNAVIGYDIVDRDVLTIITNHVEFVATNATFLHTNTSQLVSITNIDLCDFRRIIETNTPAQLGSLFPDLVITRTNSAPGLLVSNTVNGVVTNLSPYQPYLTIPGTVLVTNSMTNIIDYYDYEFGNVITNSTSPYSQVAYVETNIVQDPYSPAGVTNLLTNTTVRVVNEPGPCGSILIIPTNTTPRIYNYHIVSTILTNVTPFTNTVYSIQISNAFGGSFSNTLSKVTYSTNYAYTAYPIEFRDPRDIGTNSFGLRREKVRQIKTHVLAAHPIQIVSNAPGLEFPLVSERTEIVRQGVQSFVEVYPIQLVQGGGTNISALRPGVNQITFTNIAHDGVDFVPFTNVFDSVIITNGTNHTITMRRVVTQPDILFEASDLGIVGAFEGAPFLVNRTDTSNWQLNDSLNGTTVLGGPGVIESPVTITFTTLLPTELTSTPFTFDESQAFQSFRWGSFDGSGNSPIVFPDGATIQAAEDAVLSR